MSNKRFQIFGDIVEDTMDILPHTYWQNKEQQKKFCDELNKLHEEKEQLRTDRNLWREKAYRLDEVIEEMMKND